MASCVNCKKQVGCPCNLIDGLCANCYSNNSTNPVQRKVFKTQEYKAPDNDVVQILQSGFTKEEKLRRINEILANALKTTNDQL